MTCKSSFLPFVLLSLEAKSCSIFPDAGMAGDYGEARILVRNTASEFATGIFDGDSDVFDENEPTVDGTKGINVRPVLAWATRVLFVEVISTADPVVR